MLENISESADGKFLRVGPSRFDPHQKEVLVPIALVDELLERDIQFDLDDLLTFRRLSRDNVVEYFNVEDLVGVDLTGKGVYFYHSNWEDSEWVGTNTVSTITVAVGSDGFKSYSFVPVEAVAPLVANEFATDDEWVALEAKLTAEGVDVDTQLFNFVLTAGSSVQVLTPKSQV